MVFKITSANFTCYLPLIRRCELNNVRNGEEDGRLQKSSRSHSQEIQCLKHGADCSM